MMKKEVKMALKIQTEFFPNTSCMRFHLMVEISQVNYQSFDRPLRPTSDQYLEMVGEKGAELVKKVMAIPGVINVSIGPYRLTVTRDSSLFGWTEIASSTEKAIKVIFGGEREEVKYLSIAEIPLAVILAEPFKRLGWLIRNAWYRIPNLAE